MAAKKPMPAKQDDSIEEEDDNWEDAVVDTDGKEAETTTDLRMRDWRDVERYREMKQLRELVDDEHGFEEIFQPPPRRLVPVRPGKAPAAGRPAKGPDKKPAAAPPAAAARPAASPPSRAKPAPRKARPAPRKAHGKAKRR